MARIFISHSSANNAEALSLRDWLVAQGWNDLFLDIHPIDGLVAADRWQAALRRSIGLCRAVIFCLSPEWVASRYCISEFEVAMQLGAVPSGVDPAHEVCTVDTTRVCVAFRLKPCCSMSMER